MFVIDIETNNSAFEGTPGYEIARILRDVADKVESGQTIGRIRDFNGNKVGTFELNEDLSEEE